ncbi:MAG: hypothetical protein ACI4A7_03505 [Prevotella sp.]
MKKIFFLSLALSVAAVSNAQLLTKDNGKLQSSTKDAFTKKINLSKADMIMGAKAPKRSYDSGLYYQMPEGAVYRGLTETSGYYYGAAAYIPPFTVPTFTNMAADKTSTSWYFSYLMGEDNLVDKTNENYVTNDDFTPAYMSDAYNGGNGWYMPVLAQDNDSYYFGESYEYGEYSGVFIDSVNNVNFDDHAHNDMYFGTGLYEVDGKNFHIYGSGLVNFGSAEEPDYASSYAIEQIYPKPMSPLSIEYIHAMAASSVSNPLPEGQKLVLVISDVKEVEDKNGNPMKVAGDNVFATYTADASNLTFLNSGEVNWTPSGMMYIYNIKWVNEEQDVWGSTVTIPVTISDAFAVTIYGFNGEATDIGFYGCVHPNEIPGISGARCIVSQGENLYSFSYQDDLTVGLEFVADFDCVEVVDKLYDANDNEYDGNILKVSADGTSVINETTGGDYVNVLAKYPWYDSEGNENYYDTELVEKAPWVSVVAEDQYYVDENDQPTDERSGLTYVTVECDPLSANESGRAVSIYFQGNNGYASAAPLIVLQGNATIEDAITNPIVVKQSANASYYNVNGQMVSKDTKGLVISNGKKFINK